MALMIVAAENDFLKDAVFALRHKIFGEEQAVFRPNENKRLSDRFDECSYTSNHICFLNDRPVASYRISLDGPSGFPVEDHYDLNSIKNIRNHSKVGLISLGCIEKDVRSSGVYPLCVYQMGKTLSDSFCDYGVVVIRKDLSTSFQKWGFNPTEHFYCDRVGKWLSKMYVDLKNFGTNLSHFIGTAKVNGFNRKMTIHLNEGEALKFSQLESFDIKFSHFRIVSGDVKLQLIDFGRPETITPFDVHPYTTKINSLKGCLLSKGKAEIELLLEDKLDPQI